VDTSPPAIIVPLVSRAEHEALRTQVVELLSKVDHLIEISELNNQALEWLVKEKKHDREEDDNA
jgi:hypothetical protein